MFPRLGFVVILTGAVVLLSTITVSHGAGAGYMEFCNNVTSCDRLKGLACKVDNVTIGEGVCVCPPGTLHDFNSDVCRAKAGEDCTVYDFGQEIFKCTEHASCHRNGNTAVSGFGTCYCDAAFQEVDGLCLGIHGTECVSNEECHMESLLACQNGKCTCDLGSDKQIWNGTFCLSLIDASCKPWGGYGRECVGNSVCNNATCECKTGWYPAEDKNNCLGDQNALCDSNDQCLPTLQCLEVNSTTITTTTAEPETTSTTTEAATTTQNSTDPQHEIHAWGLPSYAAPLATEKQCGCLAGQQDYNSTLQKCIVRAGSTCSSNPNCIPNSLCDAGSKTCQCVDKFMPTADGTTCLGVLGANCSSDATLCYGDAYYECKSSTGTCDCKNGYSHDGSRCLGFLQAECKSDDDCQGTTLSCQNGICACKGGFVPDMNKPADQRVCAATYGTSCSTSPDLCDTYNNLACQEGKCDCQDLSSMVYNGNLCVGFAGKPCVGGSGCIGNATCSESTVCECNTGFTAVDEGKTCKENGAASLSAFAVVILFCAMISTKF